MHNKVNVNKECSEIKEQDGITENKHTFPGQTLTTEYCKTINNFQQKNKNTVQQDIQVHI